MKKWTGFLILLLVLSPYGFFNIFGFGSQYQQWGISAYLFGGAIWVFVTVLIGRLIRIYPFYK